MSYTYTSTYTILEVAHETYEDVRKRLIDALEPHTPDEIDGDLIVLGHIALRCERPECNP